MCWKQCSSERDYTYNHNHRYVLDAVLFVAEHGWRLLPQYRFNYKTGEWKHVSRCISRAGISVGSYIAIDRVTIGQRVTIRGTLR